jgi:hypothetical protein
MTVSVFLALAFWLLAAMAGVMLFFAAVVTPQAFRTLAPEAARGFTRAVFPHYYAALAAMGFLAAGSAALGGRGDGAIVLAVVAGAFLYARQSMMPRINALKDAQLAGDEAAGDEFSRVHRMSVALNMMQLLAVVAVAYGLARGA